MDRERLWYLPFITKSAKISTLWRKLDTVSPRVKFLSHIIEGSGSPQTASRAYPMPQLTTLSSKTQNLHLLTLWA